MNENRQKVAPVTDLLEYKIRVGEISNEGGHEIFHIALKHVELVDQIVYILEMDLPEKDTIAKISSWFNQLLFLKNPALEKRASYMPACLRSSLYFCSKISRIMELEIFSLVFSDLTGSSESALISSAAS